MYVGIGSKLFITFMDLVKRIERFTEVILQAPVCRVWRESYTEGRGGLLVRAVLHMRGLMEYQIGGCRYTH